MIKKMIWQRLLRSDYDLAVVTIFGAIAIVGVTPFAWYRFSSGNTIAGIMDVVIVLSICAVLTYALVTGNSSRASAFMVVATTASCIVSATVLGLPGLFWTYPALLINFLLIQRKKALALSLFALGLLAWHGKAFQSQLEVVMFVVTALVVCIVSFVFAYRTESQQQLLENLALMDPLTGAQNRRAMDKELEIAIKSHKRDRSMYGLAIMDLDHFKRINDKYGHEVGDNLLISFSEMIKKNSRKTDRFFRIGGEEFVLLLPGVDVASLRTITEHYCKFIEQHLRCQDETVSVSIGAAVLNDEENQQEWVARADNAMYAAKNAGRNCAIVDDGSSIALNSVWKDWR